MQRSQLEPSTWLNYRRRIAQPVSPFSTPNISIESQEVVQLPGTAQQIGCPYVGTLRENAGGHRVILKEKRENDSTRMSTMTTTSMNLMELIRKSRDDGADMDFLREGIRVLAQAMMEAGVVRVGPAGLAV